MRVDPRALVLVVILIALLFALHVSVLWWTRRSYPGFTRWAAAGILLLAAMCLLALRGLVPDWAGVVCDNGLIAWASILYLEGARQFVGLRPHKWPAYAAGILAVIAVAFFDYVVPSLSARATVMSVFMAIIFLSTSHTLLQAVPPQHKFGQRLTGGMFALCGALLLVRGVYFQFASPLNDSAVYFGIAGALSVAVIAALVCIGLGFTLLADERVVSDIYDARETALRAKLEIDERKQVEAILRQSEERFRTLADQAPVMIWVSGLDELCTFFNKPWLDFTGRSMERELGNGWKEGVYREDLERCLATRKTSFDARCPFQMEYRLRRSDGDYRCILDHGTPLYQKGEFVGFIGSSIDVTDRKLLTDRLLTQRVQLVDAQRLAKLASWERHMEDGAFDCSDEFLEILGILDNPPSTLVAFLERVHPKDRERVLEAALKVRSSVPPVELSYRIVQPDHEVRYVRAIVQAIRDNRGAAIRTVGTLQDITEQVKATEILRQNEERLKTAERLAHVGNWHWDIKSNKVSWSEEMFRIFGQPPEYTPSYAGFFQAVVPQDRERASREVRDALAQNRGLSSELQIAHPNGELRTIAFTAEVLLDEEGLPVSMSGATQDITVFKENEAKLLGSQEDLRALTARLVELQESGMKELARELHDDLSQHLAALAMEISILLHPTAMQSQSLSERVRTLQHRAEKLADDVHSISRRLHPAILDELGLQAAVREECWKFAERTGIPIEFEPEGELARPTAEVSLCFYRVAQEALHNIAKHARATNVHVTLASDYGKCTLRIEDNGQGFDLGGGESRNSLGLISMRERARLVKGDLTIQSKPGEGTTLEITVPVSRSK